MSRRACALLAAGLATFSTAALAGPESGLELSGYYKNLLAGSRTVFPEGQRYALDLNRLRLELKGDLAPGAALDLQYDNEILLGNYLHTAQFGLLKDQPPPQYWNLEWNYAEAGPYYGLHRLYRGSVTLAAGDTDVRIGRQRIAWGTGRFWSPLDILNPFSATQIEREQRIGVDAVLIERRFGALSRLSAVYAPGHGAVDASAALRWHANSAGIDYSFVAGRFVSDQVAGVDIATQLGDAGLRAELTGARREDGSSQRRALVGLDYAFRNTLSLSGEFYYNGAGAADRSAYDFASLFAGTIQSVGRRYFGGYAGYEITPLLKSTNYLVVNLGDRSRYFSPNLIYSLSTDVDLTLGAQLFSGGQGSEYARLNDTFYAQIQWYF
ncbi:MAG: hypothetical protein IH604_00700 [Burkholderiales bacterium]|nr:hypothetical protein [Burkholderiales bacterium]